MSTRLPACWRANGETEWAWIRRRISGRSVRLDQQGRARAERPLPGRHFGLQIVSAIATPFVALPRSEKNPAVPPSCWGVVSTPSQRTTASIIGLNERVGGVDPIEHIEADRGGGPGRG